MKFAIASLLLLLQVQPAVDETPPGNLGEWKPLPMTTLTIGNETAQIPDWQKVGFISFPPFSQGGSLGDRTWGEGDRISEVLTLGDVQDSLALQNYSINAIAQIMGWGLKEKGAISLGEFPLIENQTIGSLSELEPSILDLALNRVRPIQDLVKPVLLDRGVVNKPSIKIGTLLDRLPELSKISFSNLVLENYEFSEIPRLEQHFLHEFIGWERALISEIPGLENIPWASAPGGINLSGEIGLAYLQPNGSGGGVEGNCGDAEACPSVPSIRVLGLDQGSLLWPIKDFEVSGGNGGLSELNGGLEPTGIFPFGSAFKVVLTEVSSTEAETAAYFRSCRQEEGDVTSCSPYLIGPIPLGSFSNRDTVFFGHTQKETRSLEDALAVEDSGAVEISDVDENLRAKIALQGIEDSRVNEPNQRSGAINRVFLGFIGIGGLTGILMCIGLIMLDHTNKKPDAEKD